jgi:fatty acid desaturase
MLRYLPGIALVQVATVALALAALKTDDRELWLAIACLALIINLVTAFWFGSITSHLKKDAVAKAREQFSQEREKLRVNAEKQKSRLLKQTHAQMTKATNRAHARANFKVGAAFAGIIGAGALMMFTQFMTLGILTLATGGGALAGYLTRLRQELPSRRKQAQLEYDTQPPTRVLPPPRASRKLPWISGSGKRSVSEPLE